MLNRNSLTFLFVFSLCFIQLLTAQTYSLSNRLPVTANGNTLRNAWSGGVNAGQFLEFDLDRDNFKDLVIFDREDETFSTFVNKGGTGQVDYEYAPEYIQFFPDTCTGWVAFYDYDNDGYEDCMCGTPTSRILVFKNKGNPNGPIEFDLVQAPLSSYYGSNYLWVYAARNDYQAFDDVDYDGDMDILVFEILGGRLEWHKNQAVENGLPLDSLVFEVETQCYGNFVEDPSNCTAYLDQSSFPCLGSNIVEPGDDPYLQESGALHAGSTMLSLNLDGDTLKDLIIGDVDCSHYYALYNGGSRDTAHFVSVEDYFPSNDTPVELDLFPAGFYLDVDNDGKKDLISSPNRLDNIQNADGVMYHKNVGTNEDPDFRFQQIAFMQDQMIELGAGSAPAFVDYDNDGLQDMIVGIRANYVDTLKFEAGLALFLNVGSEYYPQFELYDNDFLGLNADTTLEDLVVTFGDIDNDGDQDMLMGETEGRILYFENTAGSGDTANWVRTASPVFDTIDVGYLSAPQWVDLDGDNDLDLIVGSEQGTTWFFEHIGDPTFLDIELITKKWGEIDLSGQFTNGYSKPFVYDYDEDGNLELLLGGISGWVEIYENLGLAPGDTFNYSGPLANHKFGSYSAPSASVLDTANGIRFFVGNMRGGLQLYDKAPVFVGREPTVFDTPDLELNLFPNPANQHINWRLVGPAAMGSVEVTIHNLLGGILLQETQAAKAGKVDLNGYPEGVYFLTLHAQGHKITKKFIVSRNFR